MNFKFDKNGRELSKWVENTVEKGEIARHEQFLLFPQCFQKAYSPAHPIFFGGLMIVIAIVFITLSPLTVVLMTVMWESSHWLGKNTVRTTGKIKQNLRKHE